MLLLVGSYDVDTAICSYPCLNLTSRNSELSAIEALTIELNRGLDQGGSGFINDVFSKIFNVTVYFGPSDKRTTSLPLSYTPCRQNQTQQIYELLSSLFLEIIPNAPNLVIEIDPQTCAVSITSSDPPPASSPLPIIIGVIVGVVVLIMILLILLISYYFINDELKALPAQIRWSYQQYKLNPLAWSFRGSSKSGTSNHPPLS